MQNETKTELARQYYMNADIKITENSALHEFGFMDWNRIMSRHHGLNPNEILSILRKKAPFGSYMSPAIYDNPSAPMGEKGFVKAFLFFDIDAKDFALSCRKSHVFHKCEKCGSENPSTKCECGAKIRNSSLPCDKCMRAAAVETERLIKVLKTDFGINDMETYFSGNEGFHIHAAFGRDNEYGTLDDRGRREIINYITKNYQLKLDANVTSDTARILRLAGSINGKSGMIKTIVKKPTDFILDSALPSINEKMNIIATCPEFKLGSKSFGPYMNETVELSGGEALYFICKNIGKRE